MLTLTDGGVVPGLWGDSNGTMTGLEHLFLGNPLGAWLKALAASALAFGLLLLLDRQVLRRLARFAARTENGWDDIVIDITRNTRVVTLVALALRVGIAFLTATPKIDHQISMALNLVFLYQGAVWANAGITFLLTRLIQHRLEGDAASATTLAAAGFLAKLLVWTVFLLAALQNLGVNVTGLVAGLGVGGIAVALAVQNILGDLFASLSIVLDQPFVIGDFVIVGDHLGTVEHIGLKTTRIRSLSGEQIIFANSDLLKSRIRNYKRMFERRVVFSLGVTYQTSHDKLAGLPDVLKGIIEAQEGVRFDRAHFQAFGDSALLFEIVYYVLDPDYNRYMDIQQAINLAIHRRFEVDGVDFAYPTQTLFLQRSSGEG